jgi:hypothetical protein
MYTTRNFKTKKELKDAIAAGERIGVYQPNDMFGNTDRVQVGEHRVTLEGPHYPAPHRWYATATVVDGKIVKVVALLLAAMLSVACGSIPTAPTSLAAAAPSVLHTVSDISCPDNERVSLGVDTHEGRVTLHITPVAGISRYQVRIVGPATRSDVTSGSGVQDGNLLYGVSRLPAGNYIAYVSTLNDCGREGPSSSVEFSFAGDIVDEPTPPTPTPEPEVPTAHFYRTDDQEGLDTHLRRNHACDAWPAFGFYYETYAGLTNVCVTPMRVDLPRWTYLGELPYGG